MGDSLNQVPSAGGDGQQPADIKQDKKSEWIGRDVRQLKDEDLPELSKTTEQVTYDTLPASIKMTIQDYAKASKEEKATFASKFSVESSGLDTDKLMRLHKVVDAALRSSRKKWGGMGRLLEYFSWTDAARTKILHAALEQAVDKRNSFSTRGSHLLRSTKVRNEVANLVTKKNSAKAEAGEKQKKGASITYDDLSNDLKNVIRDYSKASPEEKKAFFDNLTNNDLQAIDGIDTGPSLTSDERKDLQTVLTAVSESLGTGRSIYARVGRVKEFAADLATSNLKLEQSSKLQSTEEGERLEGRGSEPFPLPTVATVAPTFEQKTAQRQDDEARRTAAPQPQSASVAESNTKEPAPPSGNASGTLSGLSGQETQEAAERTTDEAKHEQVANPGLAAEVASSVSADKSSSGNMLTERQAGEALQSMKDDLPFPVTDVADDAAEQEKPPERPVQRSGTNLENASDMPTPTTFVETPSSSVDSVSGEQTKLSASADEAASFVPPGSSSLVDDKTRLVLQERFAREVEEAAKKILEEEVKESGKLFSEAATALSDEHAKVTDAELLAGDGQLGEEAVEELQKEVAKVSPGLVVAQQIEAKEKELENAGKSREAAGKKVELFQQSLVAQAKKFDMNQAMYTLLQSHKKKWDAKSVRKVLEDTKFPIKLSSDEITKFVELVENAPGVWEQYFVQPILTMKLGEILPNLMEELKKTEKDSTPKTAEEFLAQAEASCISNAYTILRDTALQLLVQQPKKKWLGMRDNPDYLGEKLEDRPDAEHQQSQASSSRVIPLTDLIAASLKKSRNIFGPLLESFNETIKSTKALTERLKGGELSKESLAFVKLVNEAAGDFTSALQKESEVQASLDALHTEQKAAAAKGNDEQT
ncbi:hypothetical protein JYU14_00200 [Simkania negevensis]|uniref:Uncharacterized protein n=1 Tax=Simkania negevensis TaxID=83561 RepID=A0ABS3AQY6_9BACT|nr:hypothetical protein [Simkania negevensis]